MKRLICVTLLSLAVSACASDPSMPQWLLDARAREAEPMRTSALRSADGFFRAKVPATQIGTIGNSGDAYLVQFDIGATAPMECFLYRKGLDPAASLAMIAAGTFEAIGASLGEVDFKTIDAVDAGAMGGSPYLYVSWLYRIKGEAGLQMGEVKHLTTQSGGRTLHCLHNELGYTQTFRRVAAALVQTVKYGRPLRARPYFTQVSTLTIGGQHVGFEQTTLTRDAEGDTRVDLRTSIALPVSSDTLRTSDSFGVEFADSEGRLINQVHVENLNGELVTNVALDPQADGSWRVSGTYETKEISAELRAERPPTSWLGEVFALRRTLAKQGVGSELSLIRWMPGADPEQLIDERLSIESQVEPDRYGARLRMADLEADLVVDAKGSITQGSVDFGFGHMAIERVYVGGRF